MIKYKEIIDENQKSIICENILTQLPNWFGVGKYILEYANSVRDMFFYSVFEDEKQIGFVAVKNHNEFTSEIYVMGILEKYHRVGIGEKLFYTCEKYCLENKKIFLTVKTLDESRESTSYKKTRLFYFKMGFVPLEVFKTIWDEENPCLFLVKSLKN